MSEIYELTMKGILSLTVIIGATVMLIVGLALLPVLYAQYDKPNETYLATQNLTFSETESKFLNVSIPCGWFLSGGSMTLTGYNNTDPSVDIAFDNVTDWSHAGLFNDTTETFNLPLSQIQPLLTGLAGNCMIANNFTSTNGTLEISATYHATTMTGGTLLIVGLLAFFIVIGIIVAIIKTFFT